MIEYLQLIFEELTLLSLLTAQHLLALAVLLQKSYRLVHPTILYQVGDDGVTVSLRLLKQAGVDDEITLMADLCKSRIASQDLVLVSLHLKDMRVEMEVDQLDHTLAVNLHESILAILRVSRRHQFVFGLIGAECDLQDTKNLKVQVVQAFEVHQQLVPLENCLRLLGRQAEAGIGRVQWIARLAESILLPKHLALVKKDQIL